MLGPGIRSHPLIRHEEVNVIAIIDAVRHIADADPERIAVATTEGTLSYSELHRIATAYASTLASAAGSSGAIAVVCDSKDDAVPLVLGAMLTTRPVVLIPPQSTAGARDAAQHHTGCSQIAWPGDRPGTAHIEPGRTGANVSPSEAVLVFCTSGSTGRPKLVPVREAAISRFATWAADQFGIAEGTKVLGYAPLNFDLSLLEVWITLAYGGTVISVTGAALRDGRRLATLVRTWQPDVIEGVPILYQRLAHGLAATGGGILTARHVIMTGDNTPRTTRQTIREILPAATYYNVYGSTETNDSLIAELDAKQIMADRIPLGAPLPGVDIRLLDEAGVEVAEAGVGELLVTTPFQMTGYLGPLSGQGLVERAGTTYFRSGDLVERHLDGSLDFVGRRDFRIKVNGVSVDLEDIEDVILELDAVAEAVVMPWRAPSGETSVAAVIRTAHDGILTSVDVRRFCAGRVEAAAVPFRITFADEPLPRTSTGKIDRNAATRLLPADPS